MQIFNSTKWNTDDLRKLFSEAKRRIDVGHKKAGDRVCKKLRVDVRNKNWGSINGWGYIGYGRMSIIIGKDYSLDNPEAVEHIAKTFTHEYHHNLGYRSIDRRNYKCDFTKKFDYSWVKDFQIRLAEPKIKEPVNHQLLRYESALANFRKAETRMKRAKTLFNKWYSKIKYYEKTYQFASKK